MEAEEGGEVERRGGGRSRERWAVLSGHYVQTLKVKRQKSGREADGQTEAERDRNRQGLK